MFWTSVAGDHDKFIISLALRKIVSLLIGPKGGSPDQAYNSEFPIRRIIMRTIKKNGILFLILSSYWFDPGGKMFIVSLSFSGRK